MLNKLLTNLWIKHPRTGQVDAMLSLVVFVVVICAIKFLFDGAHFVILGHAFDVGHTDSFSYGSLLTPVLGAHATREWKIGGDNDASIKPDNPDA